MGSNMVKPCKTCALTRVSWSWNASPFELEEPLDDAGEAVSDQEVCRLDGQNRGPRLPPRHRQHTEGWQLPLLHRARGRLQRELRSQQQPELRPTSTVSHALENTEILAAAAPEAVLASPGLRFIAGDFNFEASKNQVWMPTIHSWYAAGKVNMEPTNGWVSRRCRYHRLAFLLWKAARWSNASSGDPEVRWCNGHYYRYD